MSGNRKHESLCKNETHEQQANIADGYAYYIEKQKMSSQLKYVVLVFLVLFIQNLVIIYPNSPFWDQNQSPMRLV